MHYYLYDTNVLFSSTPKNLEELKEIKEEEAEKLSLGSILYFLREENPSTFRRSFTISSPSHLSIKREDLNLLKELSFPSFSLPSWIEEKILKRSVSSINLSDPNWHNVFLMPNLRNKKWKIHVVGLGDVGGTLVTGLRLLGKDRVSQIGIFDKDVNKIKRWQYEAGQILSSSPEDDFPEIVSLEETELFQCDMFVFCVSVGVPEVGNEKEDVRLVQLKGNCKIISHYAIAARECAFNGIFAVVSDPVDLLCKAAFIESNKNKEGKMDYRGLSADQIRGYGLGVMHARAAFYAKEKIETSSYPQEGRAFGPHGEGLIIANSISNYDEELSTYLTDSAKKANLEVRAAGFKPYIAPALSSGALSILSTISGKWHYSATFIGGTFMGTRNRLLPTGIELESFHMPDALFKKLEKTYTDLKNFCF